MKYKSVKFSGDLSIFVIRIRDENVMTGNDMSYDSRDVFELAPSMSGQLGAKRLDTSGMFGPKIKFNSSNVMMESDVTDPKFISFLESVDAKATEAKSGIVSNPSGIIGA